MSDDKFIFLNSDSESEKLQSVSKEEAIEEEDRLTKMMDRYFQNMNMDEPIQDTQGVDQPIMGQSLTEDEEQYKETSQPQIETEEEEVFLIHPDGDITSEAEEITEPEKEVVYKQSIMDRTIYNLAIQSVYHQIQDYRELLDMVHSDMESKTIRSFTQDLRTHEREIITGWLKELADTQFSLYKSTPSEDVIIENIQDEDLKRLVELEIEQQIIERLGLEN